MAIFLIDPFDKEVSDVQAVLDAALEVETDLLDFVRGQLTNDEERPVRQVTMIAVNHNQVAMFVDNFGMLKGEQKFWRFREGGDRVAGRAVLFGVDLQTGLLGPLHQATVEDVKAAIVWEEGIALLRIEEIVITTPGEMPSIARIPVFSDDPHPKVLEQIRDARLAQPTETQPSVSATSPGPGNATSQPGPSQAGPRGDAEQDNIALDTGWIVRALANGAVQAVRYVLEADSIRPSTERLHAANLAELRKLMPEGYERQEPDDEAESDVLELWVLRDQRVASTARH
jgi:hypothetical protein